MDLMIGKNFCTMMPYNMLVLIPLLASSSWNMVFSGRDAEGVLIMTMVLVHG